jgi:hydroxypyruvate isomerase
VKYALCIETIFPTLAFEDRLRLTREAGFNAVELWSAGEDRLPALRNHIKDGLEVAMLIGASQLTTRDAAQIEANLESVRRNLDVARELGCPNLCLFVGNRDDNATFTTQRNAVIDFLGQSAEILKGSGVTGIVESVSPEDHAACWLLSMHDATSIVGQVNRPEIKLQFDIFHTALTDDGVENLIEKHFDDIAYFQAADAPGRGEPGTGELNYERILKRLQERNFGGYFTWEFVPKAEAMQAVAAARAVQP